MPPTSGSLLLKESAEARTVYLPERPMTFDEFLDAFGPDDEVELVEGVPQQRMAAQFEHERLVAFLVQLLGVYARECNLGVVVGSRTPVRISEHGARLPDVVFVRREHVAAMENRNQDVIPDLVIEIISPGDRPSELLVLESEYRSIGVTEIVFIDQRRSLVQTARHLGGATGSERAYEAETLLGPAGILRLEALGGVELPLTWLMADDCPSIVTAVARWMDDHRRDSRSA